MEKPQSKVAEEIDSLKYSISADLEYDQTRREI